MALFRATSESFTSASFTGIETAPAISAILRNLFGYRATADNATRTP